MPLSTLPGPSDPAFGNVLLERLLTYVQELGLALYPHQEEAIFEILAGKHVVLATPTGSGKSLVATAFLAKALGEGKTGFYSCPVKALVNEKFFALCEAFGPENVALVTGDASVNRAARIVCGTAEILANRVVRGDVAPDYVVMDEFHYYGDKERGMAWQLPLVALPRTTFLLMSATLGDTTGIERHIQAATGREVAAVRGAARPVPLEFDYRETPLHETIADLVKTGRAPVYLVNFTQRTAAEEAQNLMSVELISKPEKEALKEALMGERFGSPYGKELSRFLRQGVGLHHAGLLPRYRRLVERLAQKGLIKVVAGTDTLGVGVNIPIRTVLFSQLCKFDGDKDIILPVREFQQIAGRAGRKGFDDRGWVVVQAPAHVIENRRLSAAGKKFVKRLPPKKGYVPWDKGTFDRLVAGNPEPLESRFAVTHALVLGCLQGGGDVRRGGGYRHLLDLIRRCHEGPPRQRHHRRTAARCFRTLRTAGLVHVALDERARAPHPEPSAELQGDFSLHHTLALYLVDTLAKLDIGRETYPLDVLSLVEAILENPRPVLMAQLSQVKTDAIAEMKADGLEYEERMEKLDELEWPKPNRDFIYETFNDFARAHPWVGEQNIAPKGVARAVVEEYCSFHDAVRGFGVERSEGVLLRYLADAWKTLAQSVPARFKTDGVLDLIETLGALVRTVDASLAEEWEAMQDPDAVPEVAASVQPAPLPARKSLAQLAREPRGFGARVRTELHRLLGALTRKDWPEVLAAMTPLDPEGEPWTAERVQKVLAPLYSPTGTFARGLDVSPAARSPRQTTIRPLDETQTRFEAFQTLHARARLVTAAAGERAATAGTEDAEGPAAELALRVQIDVSTEARAGVAEDAPLIALVGLG